MDITSVKKSGSGYVVNGTLHVPPDVNNRHYLAVVDYIDNGGLVESGQSLDDLRKSKKAEIVLAYEKAMQSLVSDYPLKERETWRKQEEQARAFIEDSYASTPGLDALATASGRDKLELANKIIEKADALEVVSLALTGKKQALIAQIEMADESALETVVW